MVGLVRRRVLVVNDDCRLAESVKSLLSDTGYDTRVAFDGKQGLELLAHWPADLVLLDLIMPGLDGLGFLGRLAGATGRLSPIVLVWSLAGAEELEHARFLGATECLQRASTGPDQLLDAIARLLERQPTA